LEKLGWRCLVVWQCRLHDKAALRRLLAAFLNIEDSPASPPPD
jgi:G:T-mismatch repair DNA endonuclease (very short patch repair protein)